MSLDGLLSLIPDWLAVTEGREIALGLGRGEALRRARALRELLRGGEVQPNEVALDECLKAVFHALVVLVTEEDRAPGAALIEEANDVYQFLACVEWPDDAFDEKRDLLRRLAEAGWEVLGTNLDGVDRGRGDTLCYRPPIQAEGMPRLSSGAEHWSGLAAQGRELCRDRNRHPRKTSRDLARLYEDVLTSSGPKPLFDVRDALLGDLAVGAASALRGVGEFDRARTWLNHAEGWYRLLPSSQRCLARLELNSLALEYDLRNFALVVRVLPQLLIELELLGMHRCLRVGLVLEANTLKSLGNDAEALRRFESILRDDSEADGVDIRAHTLIEIGGIHGRAGDLKQALRYYEKALAAGTQENPILAAYLAACFGETLRTSGDLGAAILWLKRSVNEYEAVGSSVQAAYVRLLLADALIDGGLPDLALSEVVTALPVIEEKRLVPDGFMAIALLRESVRRRKADRDALRELREHLQKQQ